jgi:hypothetical protein
MAEQFENGGTVTAPNTRDPTHPEDYEFTIEWPESYPDAAGVLDYPKDLDREIMTGLGVPPEVFEAAEVGSGWSGRMIPYHAWLTSCDELVGLLLEAFDYWILRNLVAVNFGPDARYEVDPVPLAEVLLKSAS